MTAVEAGHCAVRAFGSRPLMRRTAHTYSAAVTDFMRPGEAHAEWRDGHDEYSQYK